MVASTMPSARPGAGIPGRWGILRFQATIGCRLLAVVSQGAHR